MIGLRISEVAQLTGLTASAIRFYESAGLVEPAARGSNGYRVYQAADVERLSFIAGAKSLNLGLDEVRRLVVARESELCAHVQSDMRSVVTERLDQARAQIEELSRLADELERAADRLASPASGRCSDACACSAITGSSMEAPDGIVSLPLRAL